MKKLILIFLILFHTSNTFSLPAFPGAEGFGSDTIGGRGGTVIKVTNLNDSGAGSFRAACEASGARYVIFATSGVIHLQSTLVIDDPYITIAGETSPGGICIAGYPTQIWAHDVIIRHLRFRIGTGAVDYDTDGNGIIWYTNPQYDIRTNHTDCAANGGAVTTMEAGGFPCALSSGINPAEQHRAVTVFGNGTPAWYPGADAYNVVLDHCSISWGIDTNFLADSGAHDITISNSIFGPSLSRAGHEKGEHGKGVDFSGKFTGVYNVSIHHNYVVHNHDRNIYVSGPFDGGGDQPGDRYVDVRNNVVYNAYTGGMIVQENAAGNWVHNYVKRGPESLSYQWELAFWNPDADANNLLYVLGNIGTHRTSQSDPEWCVGDEWRDQAITTNYQKVSAYDTGSYSVTTTTMSGAYAETVISNAGATKPSRDSIDQAIALDFTNGTGYHTIIVDNTDYPAYSNPAPPTDSDNDGMSDAWELSTFGDLDQTAITDFDSDGYTDIEEYFHYLAGPAIYDPPTIAGPADFSTADASVEIEGTYTIDPDLADQSVIVTWTLGGSSGFCVAALGVFSCTVPVGLGANSIVFTVTDSNAGTDSDTTVVTRTAVPQASITNTSISHGVLRH